MVHTNAKITKMLYWLKRKGLSDGLKHYCVLELLSENNITKEDAYQYLGLSSKDLEIQFNNITKEKK